MFHRTAEYVVTRKGSAFISCCLRCAGSTLMALRFSAGDPAQRIAKTLCKNRALPCSVLTPESDFSLAAALSNLEGFWRQEQAQSARPSRCSTASSKRVISRPARISSSTSRRDRCPPYRPSRTRRCRGRSQPLDRRGAAQFVALALVKTCSD